MNSTLIQPFLFTVFAALELFAGDFFGFIFYGTTAAVWSIIAVRSWSRQVEDARRELR